MQISLKYRPATFNAVVGQPVATRILSNSILMDRVPNALILFGLHGCGKTTLARIYAKALNCTNFNGEPCCVCDSCIQIQQGVHPGVIEYDAASHSGVDSARDFEELLSYTSEAQRKVLILDECHMLTKQAQAVLLKLIEDPPNNSIFILVTTDVSKLESTVLSRCLRVDLRPISKPEMARNLAYVLDSENCTYTQTFMDRLLQQSNGSLRDTQQIVEALILRSPGHLDETVLEDALGLIPSKAYKDLAWILNVRDLHQFLALIKSWYTQGLDLSNFFIHGVPCLLRDFMLSLTGAQDITLYSGISLTTLKNNLVLTYPEIKAMLRQWETTMELMCNTSFPRIIWETYAVAVCEN